MAAMGIGSYFSRFVPDKPLLVYFIEALELVARIVGGLSVPLLYFVTRLVCRYRQLVFY